MRHIFERTPLSGWAEPFTVYLMLAVLVAPIGDVCGNCLRFCERSNPLVIEQFGCGVFFFPQAHELRVEEEPTLFWGYHQWPTSL